VNDRTIRDEIAEALALHLNGPASDGRGWYRTDEQRAQCYEQADAVLAALSKTDLLVDQGRIFRVIEASRNDANDEYQDFTVYTAPEFMGKLNDAMNTAEQARRDQITARRRTRSAPRTDRDRVGTRQLRGSYPTRQGAAVTDPFFESGKTYIHSSPNGSEGIFDVRYVGAADSPFEHHSETLGVAFGWLWGPSPNGTWEGRGSYTTPDFAGWEEILPPPCGATVAGYICVLAERRSHHLKHVAVDGSYWYAVDPCGRDECQHAERIDRTTVYCGAASDVGESCYFIADHERPHTYEGQPHTYEEQP
jgi:hypothetical protein